MTEPTNQYERDMLAHHVLLGVNTDITGRWEQGIDHHPNSIAFMNMLKAIDWLYCDGHFDWKTGGDGDSGETLMYEMDILFDALDAGEL